MRINYNILWFENDDEWFKPTQRNLKNYLDDFGFLLKAILEKDNSHVEALIDQIRNNVIDIDVIFMDYRLAKETKGDTIIKAIRQTELFTEILFYSNQANVKDIIEAEIGSVEGIYYAARDTFLDKAKTVIRHAIKKVQEVNSMRGLIMSATSDLDAAMKEIINAFYESYPETNTKTVTEAIFEEVGTQINSKNKFFEQCRRNNRIDRLIKDNLIFDAQKKAFATQKIIDQIADESIADLKGNVFFETYSNEVIAIRNDFAHVTDCINKDGKRVLQSRTSEKEFTDEMCIEARKSLIRHLDKIESIKQIIVDEAESIKGKSVE